MSEKHYKSNFLSEVIFRIDYPTILELTNTQPSEFQKKLFDNFPILEPIQQFGIKIEKQALNLETTNLSKNTWKFFSKDRKKTVEIDAEYLAVSFLGQSYKNYQDFKETIEKVVDMFFAVYPSALIQRLGIRYINQIKIDGEEDVYSWNEYINPKLTNFINFIENKASIKRALNMFTLSVGEDAFLNFRYGLYNSTFPNEIINKEYILDYDCYTETQLEKEKIFDKADLFNKEITDLFEKSIEEKFRKLLNK